MRIQVGETLVLRQGNEKQRRFRPVEPQVRQYKPSVLNIRRACPATASRPARRPAHHSIQRSCKYSRTLRSPLNCHSTTAYSSSYIRTLFGCLLLQGTCAKVNST